MDSLALMLRCLHLAILAEICMVTAHRFALPHKQQLLGLPAGQCIKVKATTAKGAELVQAFNPISTDDTPGEVVLLVKVSACTPQTLHLPTPSASSSWLRAA